MNMSIKFLIMALWQWSSLDIIQNGGRAVIFGRFLERLKKEDGKSQQAAFFTPMWRVSNKKATLTCMFVF